MMKWPQAVFAPPDDLGGIPGGGQPSGDPAPQQTPSLLQEAPVAVPPGLPEQFWDAEKKSVKADDLTALLQLKADADARAAARPEKPELYKPAFTEGFKLPEGVGEIKFKTDDPEFQTFAQIAHESGWSQEKFSRALEKVAQVRVDQKRAEMDRQRAFVEAEDRALGANAKERRQAADSIIKAFGFPEAVTKELQMLTVTAAGTRAVELLHEKFSGGVVAGKPAGQAPPAEKPKGLTYERLYDHPTSKVS